MLIDLVKFIRDELIKTLPEYNDGIYLAHLDEEGRVIVKKGPGYKYAGISDNKVNYFYLRFAGDGEEIDYELSDTITSCTPDHLVKAKIRIVSVIKNTDKPIGQVNEFNQNDKLAAALIGLKWREYTGGEKNVSLELTKAFLNPFDIIDEETGGKKARRPFKGDYVFNVLDFNLNYLYLFNDCLKC